MQCFSRFMLLFASIWDLNDTVNLKLLVKFNIKKETHISVKMKRCILFQTNRQNLPQF